MSFIKEENIGKISFISSALLVVLLTTTLGCIFIYSKYKHFEENLIRVEKNFTDVQKERLRSEVNIQIGRFNVRRNNIERALKISIENRVNEAHAIAQNLYQLKNKSPEDIQSLIREALRPIRFNNGRGSIFIRTLDGNSVLYSPDTAREGVNVNLPPHQNRSELFQKMIDIAQSDGEGFIKYHRPKPGGGENEFFEKISFVKCFEPLGWIIGSSEYPDNIEENLRQSLINYLNNVVPDLDSPDYLFVYKIYDINGGNDFASMLINPNRPDLIGQKISDSYTDAKGKMFRKEMLQGIRDKGEAYVTYWYKKPGAETLTAKLSYFKYYPEWNWVVAKGTYLDHWGRHVGLMQDGLRQEIKDTVRYLVYFSIITCVLFLGIGYLFSKGIHNIFARYKKIQQGQQDKLAQANATLNIQATTDSLTKLYNRGYFNKHSENEIARSERYQSNLSLIIFDIDNFKHINDTFGHLAGDDILKDLSRLCQTTIRPSDILARWGGEEFVILIPENDKKEATFVADKLRKSIEGHSFSIEHQVTCSFGITQHIAGEELDDVINRADKALYVAKHGGKNKAICL